MKHNSLLVTVRKIELCFHSMQHEYFSLNSEHNLKGVTNVFMVNLRFKVKVTNFEPIHFLKERPIIRCIVGQ